MEGLKELFPVPVYINMIELDDIEIPNFEDSNVVRKEIPELKDKVFSIVSEMIQTIGYVDQPLKLNDMWFNRYDDNRPLLEYHFHQNCAWTGTYFPEDSNHSLTIHNPMAGLYQGHYPKVERPTGWNLNYIQLNDCKKGYCIIHPSYLAHHVWWNGTKPSHSISFDIAYQLPIGDKDFGSYSE